jgi:hypothetical protein
MDRDNFIVHVWRRKKGSILPGANMRVLGLAFIERRAIILRFFEWVGENYYSEERQSLYIHVSK